jgi:amino acid permease
MALADVRDIAIVILAVESIVVGILLILLLWQLRSLTLLLQEEVKPMLDALQETIGTVKGTTSLVSETIVSPAVRISGFVAGLRRALEVILTREPAHDEE